MPRPVTPSLGTSSPCVVQPGLLQPRDARQPVSCRVNRHRSSSRCAHPGPALPAMSSRVSPRVVMSLIAMPARCCPSPSRPYFPGSLPRQPRLAVPCPAPSRRSRCVVPRPHRHAPCRLIPSSVASRCLALSCSAAPYPACPCRASRATSQCAKPAPGHPAPCPVKRSLADEGRAVPIPAEPAATRRAMPCRCLPCVVRPCRFASVQVAPGHARLVLACHVRPCLGNAEPAVTRLSIPRLWSSS